MSQTIIALFDNREDATNAVLTLREAGIPNSDITISPESAVTALAADAEPHAKGFWASLEELFGGTDDHPTYAEGVRRGGVMVTAHVDDGKVDEAVALLERHGSIDLDEREVAWRGEGWTGTSAITGGGIANEGAGPIRSMISGAETETDVTVARTAAVTTAVPAYKAPVALRTERVMATRGDDVIQLVEESLNVGKRAVNRGKVRIHSYVVETPVTEMVSLRDETVTVDRRPVDRVLGIPDLGVDAFKDRVIEMEELDEEAVVAKTVRVVEEIGIRKDVTDRTQTITDTVRSTKVDIEDGRTVGRATTFFTDASSIASAKDMEVLGSDGQHVGVVDHVDGTTIKLKKMDPASGGSHHRIPTDWVDHVDQRVHLNRDSSNFYVGEALGENVPSALATLRENTGLVFRQSVGVEDLDGETKIIDRLVTWAGNRKEAERWYRESRIPAFGGLTAHQAFKRGYYNALDEYISGLLAGEFA